jgi:hypothetical protein
LGVRGTTGEKNWRVSRTEEEPMEVADGVDVHKII